MASKSFKNITLGLAALSTALFMGCMGSDVTGSSQDAGYGSVSVSISTGTVNAASKSGLKKGSTISLKKMIVTMISNATPADTVRDTIVAGVNQGLVANSTANNQVVDSNYVLKALRTWYITVKTLDTKDSVVHTTTDSVVKLLAGQTVTKSLTLTPRFVMYVARFNFPDSLSSTTGGAKQKMNVTRLFMKVGGVTVVDSSAAFAPSTIYNIGYDYIPVSTAKTVEIQVIGNLVGWSFAGDSTLFKHTNISVGGVAASVSDSQSVSLPYVGPVTGKVNMTITINKVGTYTIITTTPPASVPKNKQ